MEESLDKLLLLNGWTLQERIAAASKVKSCHSPQRYKNLLEKWKKLVGANNRDILANRLKLDNLSLEDAHWVIDPPEECVPTFPDWWPILKQLQQAAKDSTVSNESILLIDDQTHKLPFVDAWIPIVHWALGLLKHRFQKQSVYCQLSQDAWIDLAKSLLRRLSTRSEKALGSLFIQGRSPGQVLLAHLKLEDTKDSTLVREAYDAFIADLLSTGFKKLFETYPVLGRLLALAVQQWIEDCVEILNRISESRAQLFAHFDISTEAVLSGIQLDLSEPHNDGRSVAILCFDDNAEKKRVVYKPKNIELDVAYQDFIGLINDGSTLGPMRELKIISMNEYGFVEYVEYNCAQDDHGLKHFYRNSGRLIAILYLLGCNDCDAKNLIASDQELILIDTEALFGAQMMAHDNEHDHLSLESGDTQAGNSVSLLQSGLLPKWQMMGTPIKRAYDTSALGTHYLQETECEGWEAVNTDGMLFGQVIKMSKIPTCIPVDMGKLFQLSQFSECICEGFRDQLAELIRLRAKILPSLDQFSSMRKRYFHRSSRLYSSIQQQMLQPDSLRCIVEHCLKLEQLARSYVLASNTPEHWPLLKSEVKQMERLDIPFFQQNINGSELFLPQSIETLSTGCELDGVGMAKRRLQSLNEREVARQERLIRRSLMARNHQKIDDTDKVDDEYLASSGTLISFPNEEYRRQAFLLGNELWESSIEDCNGSTTWLGIDYKANSDTFYFGLIDQSLYSGLLGIALFFARLAIASEGVEADLWRERASECIHSLEKILSPGELYTDLTRRLPIGLGGIGGVLLALHLLQNAGIKQASSLANTLLDHLEADHLLADQAFDIIGGVAGLIGPLLQIGTVKSHDLAIVCGRHLIASQLESGGWPQPGDKNTSKPPLTGFSHGAGGIAAALARLSIESAEPLLTEAVNRAIMYESGVFVPGKANWPDFRNTSNSNQFFTGWCHGAPGILLSRLILHIYNTQNPQVLSDLNTARLTTLETLNSVRQNSGHVERLCCGLIGLTSILRVDSKVLDRPLDQNILKAESRTIARALRNERFRFFVFDQGSGTVDVPGLFTGQAGLGLSLLESGDRLLWLPTVLSAGLL